MADPTLLPLVVATVRRHQRERMAGPRTDVVIDGYPRSANTFTVHAFRHANPDARIAHHLHCAGHLRRGVRLGLPTVLVVRDPLAACRSEAVRDRRRSLPGALDDWIHLHRALGQDLDGIVVAPFEQVTTDLGTVIDEVNDRFGTTFTPYRNSPEVDELVLARVQAVTDAKWVAAEDRQRRSPRPTPERSDAADEVDAVAERPEVATLVDEARRIHADLVARRAAT